MIKLLLTINLAWVGLDDLAEVQGGLASLDLALARVSFAEVVKPAVLTNRDVRLLELVSAGVIDGDDRWRGE